MQAWADINIVFGGGWPPSEMDNMTLDELVSWWYIARQRHKMDNS
ncbi:GpE family phage tail protein [Rappaport israeli]|nr:GpE family phage tail protein [Rappaport israeli]